MVKASAPSVPYLRECRTQAPVQAQPFHEWTVRDGKIWTLFYRVGDTYLLRFPELADFVVSPSGLDVAAYPVSGISLQTVEHLYQNQVLPLALSRQFKLVLHAGAVEIDDVAVAFLGVSGRGKSTLTASFATSGYRFLTDDGAQLEKIGADYYIRPGHHSIRLWDDSRNALVTESTRAADPLDYTPKSRLLAGAEMDYCSEGRRLKAMYFLGNGDTDSVSIAPIGGRDAMIALVEHSFLLDIEEREMLSHHFRMLTELVRQKMFFRLDYPRRYAELPNVREAVLTHVRSLGMATAG